MFDTREYEWSDVEVRIGGRVFGKMRGVRYKASKEKELVYGAGNEPVGIQSGNKAYEGELTMLRSDYDTLAAAGGGSVLDIRVDIVVNYGNPAKGDRMMTDKLLGCEFTEEEHSSSQGDKFEEMTLPFIFLRKL